MRGSVFNRRFGRAVDRFVSSFHVRPENGFVMLLPYQMTVIVIVIGLSCLWLPPFPTRVRLATSVERTTLNRVVVGSIPTFGTFCLLSAHLFAK